MALPLNITENGFKIWYEKRHVFKTARRKHQLSKHSEKKMQQRVNHVGINKRHTQQTQRVDNNTEYTNGRFIVMWG